MHIYNLVVNSGIEPLSEDFQSSANPSQLINHIYLRVMFTSQLFMFNILPTSFVFVNNYFNLFLNNFLLNQSFILFIVE
jgi:hypothetical protein